MKLLRACGDKVIIIMMFNAMNVLCWAGTARLAAAKKVTPSDMNVQQYILFQPVQCRYRQLRSMHSVKSIIFRFYQCKPWITHMSIRYMTRMVREDWWLDDRGCPASITGEWGIHQRLPDPNCISVSMVLVLSGSGGGPARCHFVVSRSCQPAWHL